jgi:hypothetical protein
MVALTERGNTMAEIYTLDGGLITEGLQGCTVCAEAIKLAKEIADDRGEPVRLYDDDGVWLVHPAPKTGKRKVESDEEETARLEREAKAAAQEREWDEHKKRDQEYDEFANQIVDEVPE